MAASLQKDRDAKTTNSQLYIITYLENSPTKMYADWLKIISITQWSHRTSTSC